MDGKRIQDYLSKEVASLVEVYEHFEKLVPNEKTKGSAHKGEDGRYAEELIRQYLRKYLPTSVEILTGFVFRPAVKTGLSSKRRKKEDDKNSTQLDIIVYDSTNYPIFHRFGDNVIVPPEGVLAIISVKKHFNDSDIKDECKALMLASKLCEVQNKNGDFCRGPFLAMVAIKSNIKKKRPPTEKWVFKKMKEVYNTDPAPYFDNVVGYIGALAEWSIFKPRPLNDDVDKAKYLFFSHADNEAHLGLQFLLTGILSVFYDPTRSALNRPGFTAFPSKRGANESLGDIKVAGLRPK